MSYIYDDEQTLNNIAVPFDYGELEITPNDNYIDAAKCFITKLDEIIYLLLKKEQDGRAHVKTAVWALALALGSKHLEGKSMTEIAEHLDVTRAAISKQTVQFSRMLNLPASPYMAPTRKSYGKETELKKAARLAAGVDDKASSLSVIELTKKVIEHNILSFIDGAYIPVEPWGVVNRVDGDVSSVFIANQYIERLFNGSDTQRVIVAAWYESKALVIKPSKSLKKNRSSLVRMGQDVHRGYLINYNSCNSGVVIFNKGVTEVEV